MFLLYQCVLKFLLSQVVLELQDKNICNVLQKQDIDCHSAQLSLRSIYCPIDKHSGASGSSKSYPDAHVLLQR